MKEKTSPLARLIAAIEIQDVRLIETLSKTTIRTPAEIADPILNVSWEASTGVRFAGGFYVLVSMQTRVVAKNAQEKPVVMIKGVFELKYQIKSAIEPTDKELEDFARINGVYNAWPYGRALIQSISSQMNLPPITIPVFRVAERLQRRDREVKQTSKHGSVPRHTAGGTT